LARRPQEGSLRAFWILNGAWCAVNLVIAGFAWPSPGTNIAEIRCLLWASEGFNVACLATGLVLARSPRPPVFGAGVAVALQSLALLALDGLLLFQLHS
jgi:hypothetical protein